MKLLIVMLTILSFSLAVNLSLKNEFLELSDIEFEIPEALATEFLELENAFDEKVGIDAVSLMNDYADQLLENIRNLFMKISLDPMRLPKIQKNLSNKSPSSDREFNMDYGVLEGLLTIKRAENCEVFYSSSSKTGETLIPITFDQLMFGYGYNTNSTLPGRTGDVNGKVENLKLKAALRLDFKKYQTSLSQFQITNSGRIQVSFPGDGLSKWKTNKFTNLVILAVHPIIGHIIEILTRIPLLTFVEDINQLIESFVHSKMSDMDPQIGGPDMRSKHDQAASKGNSNCS